MAELFRLCWCNAILAECIRIFTSWQAIPFKRIFYFSHGFESWQYLVRNFQQDWSNTDINKSDNIVCFNANSSHVMIYLVQTVMTSTVKASFTLSLWTSLYVPAVCSRQTWANRDETWRYLSAFRHSRQCNGPDPFWGKTWSRSVPFCYCLRR